MRFLSISLTYTLFMTSCNHLSWAIFSDALFMIARNMHSDNDYDIWFQLTCLHTQLQVASFSKQHDNLYTFKTRQIVIRLHSLAMVWPWFYHGERWEHHPHHVVSIMVWPHSARFCCTLTLSSLLHFLFSQALNSESFNKLYFSCLPINKISQPLFYQT